MQQAQPHFVFDRLAIAFAVIGLAGLVTYVEVAPPAWANISSVQSRVKDSSPAATAKPKVVAQTPAPAKPKAPAVKTATTSSYVHMRASKSTTSPIVMNIDPGTVVELRDDSDAKWQAVNYKGKNGYIFKSYIQY